jgi:hypothetical protein
MTTETTTKIQPAHKIRIPGATATIWANTSKKGTLYYSVGFDRSYKDAGGNWKQTSMFGVDDLLALAKVADLAHDYIRAKLQEEPSE